MLPREIDNVIFTDPVQMIMQYTHGALNPDLAPMMVATGVYPGFLFEDWRRCISYFLHTLPDNTVAIIAPGTEWACATVKSSEGHILRLDVLSNLHEKQLAVRRFDTDFNPHDWKDRDESEFLLWDMGKIHLLKVLPKRVDDPHLIKQMQLIDDLDSVQNDALRAVCAWGKEAFQDRWTINAPESTGIAVLPKPAVRLADFLGENETLAAVSTTASSTFHRFSPYATYLIMDATTPADKQDNLACLKATLDRLLAAGVPDNELQQLTGMCPRDNIAGSGEKYYEVDRGYVLPGELMQTRYIEQADLKAYIHQNKNSSAPIKAEHYLQSKQLSKKEAIMPEIKKNIVYINVHEKFVRENIPYEDKETGEPKTFNTVTLPKGTQIDGQDMGGYSFSPLYINDSKFNENMKTIPLIAENEVWLTKSTRDENGTWHRTDPVKVAPEKLKAALVEGRKSYREAQAEKQEEVQEPEHDEADLEGPSVMGAMNHSQAVAEQQAQAPSAEAAREAPNRE